MEPGNPTLDPMRCKNTFSASNDKFFQWVFKKHGINEVFENYTEKITVEEWRSV